MPSPYTRDQLSPPMQARYGVDRRPVGRWIGIGVVALVFTAILVGVTVALTTRDSVQNRLLSWTVQGPDRVDLTYQVTPDGTEVVQCILRAQDSRRIDVGYAVEAVAPTANRVPEIRAYSLRTLAPAYTTELLGCATGTLPAVPPPQFPPGVVAPEQPWAAAQESAGE
ncbi:MAG: DUF4307 domain-containing protein [Actinomycetota bacterium]|nr:DUF4307 domain-containing protein [Actinomycetota bacterium]